MPHLIARHPDTGDYLHRDHPDFAEHAQEISGELRKVTMYRMVGGELVPLATDHVPVEHVDEYRRRALSNEGRNVAAGDVAWDHVEVGAEHDSGRGGDDQHWHEEQPVQGGTPADYGREG